MLLGRDKPRKRKPRGQLTRRLYSGTLTGVVLALKRGVHIRVTSAEGEIISDTFDPALGLMCAIGDRLVLTGRDESIALVQVTRIEPGWSEKLFVGTVTGSVVDGPVFIMSAKGLRS